MTENHGWSDPASVERLLDAARSHGETSGCPDHEVGDLQEILRGAWNTMDAGQKRAFRGADSVDQTLFFLESSHVTDRTPDDDFIALCLKAARDHGNASEADHEAGDLQDMIRDGWALMNETQRAIVAAARSTAASEGHPA